MSIAAQHLAQQFRVAYGAARMNLRGISPEEALVVPDGRGSSANWITGHLVLMRGHVHELLGIVPVEGTDALGAYARGSTAPSSDHATDQSALVRMWKASQAAVDGALETVTERHFEAPLEQSGPLLGETKGSALAFFAFHEAYHTGQLGLTRRRLGKDGAIT
jgi:hypothetical protein